MGVHTMFSKYIVIKLASVLLCCVLCEALVFTEVINQFRSQPPSNWTVEGFVRGHGYPIQTHIVKTEQKYYLTLHRIPYGKSGPSANRPIVLIQHGAIVNSASWLVVGPDNSLAFMYADAGYDVWICNARGSTLSRKHETIDPDRNSKDFFDFTFGEMGKHDIPSVVDFILQLTQQLKLSYVGHSMGATMFFAFLSERPEYNAKIKVMFALSPAVYLQGPATAIGLRPFEQIHTIAAAFGIYEIFSYKQFHDTYDLLPCRLSSFWGSFCDFGIRLLSQSLSLNINDTAFRIMFESVPAGLTVKNVAHFAQLSRPFSEFRKFDYGFFNNFFRYGSFNPPNYDFTKITCPIHIYYGGDDIANPDSDMYRLASKFPRNLRSLNKVTGYRHDDFYIGNNLKGLNTKIIQQDKNIIN